jgi:putative copper resistance protein D
VTISIYGIHVLAAAAWAGGLPVLLFAVIEQRRFGAYDARENTLDICSRFSLMAIVAVTLIVSSGVANAGFRVAGSFGKLWDSDYGDLLLKKISIVAAMLALAYLNRFVLVPRLRAAGPKDMRQIMWLAYSCSWRICRPRRHHAAAIKVSKRVTPGSVARVST